MNQPPPHISVCICTYKRPELLKRLLTELGAQKTSERFTYSIVVVDNDRSESAKDTVLEFRRTSKVEADYCVESEQNIARARNKALQHVRGEFVAFIDDDEFSREDWLLTLFDTCIAHGVDGVLGPVKPHFDTSPPEWVTRGGFYDRATYPTGHVIHWRQGRTGNVLLRRELFHGESEAFRSDFLTGEDQDFFRRMIDKGHKFIWCNEAVAFETVPPVRWKRSFMIRRALLRGKVSLLHPGSATAEVGKSFVAVPVYLLMLPATLLLGHHVFMKYLIKTCDHLGKLFAFVGLDPVKEKYVTE